MPEHSGTGSEAMDVGLTELTTNSLVNNPDHMKLKGLKFCKDFLGGVWKNLPCDDFKMEPISGGLTNYLYLCSLADHIHPINGEPRSVVIRFYGQIAQGNHHMVLKDSVVFALLAEKQIGPNLFGIFRGGRVEEYIPSRCLRSSELSQPDTSRQIARKMAQLHQLQMPIKKEPKWLFSNINRWLTYIYGKLWTDEEFMKTHDHLRTLRQLSLKEECSVMKEILDKMPSEVVFCHNDLQEGNILQYTSPDQGQGLMPIDFEYCSYNFRGFDFGNHFCEWIYDYTKDEHPFFTENYANYPDRLQQINFFKSYLAEMNCTGDTDSIAVGLCEEAETYALASHFFYGLWAIVSSESSQISFGYVEYAEARLKLYYLCKEQLLAKLKQQKPSMQSFTPAT